MDPQEWVRQQEQRTTALLTRAEQARSSLAQAQATASARDRSVTVTVNPGGALMSLQFSPRAERLTLPQLTARIMEAYRAACAEASANTLKVMEQLVGSESSALDLIRSTLPKFDTDDSSYGSQA